MASNNAFKNICEQLDIDIKLMEDDPQAFVEAVHNKAMELGISIKEKNTISDIEQNFKRDAYRDTQAVDQAQVVYDQIMDLILEQAPEVIANLIPKFSGIIEICNNNVRSSAIRRNGRGYLNKKQQHLMYVSLKRTYDLYVEFAKAMNWIERAPLIPAITGNYGTESSSVKTYVFYINGEEWINPYSVARKVGVEIHHYMDIIDIIDKAEGQIGSFTVTYKEV